MIYLTDQPQLSGPNKETRTWNLFCYPRALSLMHEMAREACVARAQFVEAPGRMPSYEVDEQQRHLLIALGAEEAGYDKAFKVGQLYRTGVAASDDPERIGASKQVPGSPYTQAGVAVPKQYQLRPASAEGGWRPGQLDDESPMPFGKHKGQPLKAVPADYLLWFYEQDWAAEKWKGLYEYVARMYKHLQKEVDAADIAVAESRSDEDDVPF